LEEKMRHDERPGIVEMIRELSDRVAELGFGDEALGDDALTEVGHELKKDRPAAVPRRVDVDQRVHSDVDEASGAKQSPSFRLLRNKRRRDQPSIAALFNPRVGGVRWAVEQPLTGPGATVLNPRPGSAR